MTMRIYEIVKYEKSVKFDWDKKIKIKLHNINFSVCLSKSYYVSENSPNAFH